MCDIHTPQDCFLILTSDFIREDIVLESAFSNLCHGAAGSPSSREKYRTRHEASGLPADAVVFPDLWFGWKALPLYALRFYFLLFFFFFFLPLHAKDTQMLGIFANSWLISLWNSLRRSHCQLTVIKSRAQAQHTFLYWQRFSAELLSQVWPIVTRAVAISLKMLVPLPGGPAHFHLGPLLLALTS